MSYLCYRSDYPKQYALSFMSKLFTTGKKTIISDYPGQPSYFCSHWPTTGWIFLSGILSKYRDYYYRIYFHCYPYSLFCDQESRAYECLGCVGCSWQDLPMLCIFGLIEKHY